VAKAAPTETVPNAVPRNAHFMIRNDGTKSGEGTGIVFAEGSAELTPQGERRLKELMPQFLGKPNKIEIRGHTSRRPLPPGSPYKSTWELCYARCMTTLKYLAEGGVEPSRIRLSQAGAFEPITIRMGAEEQFENSRVDVYLLGERVEDYMGSRREREEQGWSPDQN
jgi:chemotaxis protein MotB